MTEPAANAARARAVDAIGRRRRFEAHAAFHVLLVLVLAVVWAISEYRNAGGWPSGIGTGRRTHDWDPWVVYPVLVGVTAIGIHARHVFGRGRITEGEIRREMERGGS